MESDSRRLRLSYDALQDSEATTKLQLLRLARRCGLVESVYMAQGGGTDGDGAGAGGSGGGSAQLVVELQFQKLSAAEQFAQELSRERRDVRMSGVPPVPCVSAAVLAACPHEFPQRAREVFAAAGAPDFAERVIEAADGLVTSAAEERAWAPHRAACRLAQRHALFAHAATATFATPADANAFLLGRARELEAEGVFCTFVGPPESPLAASLARLLERRVGRGALVEGAVLRGYVVRLASRLSCTVDLGLFASERDRRPLLLECHSNFLNVRPSSGVLVRVVHPGSGAGNDARLAIKELLAPPPPIRMRAPPSPHHQAPPPPQQSRHKAAATSLQARVQAGASARTTPLLVGLPPTAGPPELLCAFPPGVHTLATLTVRVTDILPGGLKGVCHAGAPWTVFVPSVLVPTSAAAAAAGQDWRQYAVEGESVTAAALCALSVGASGATVRVIASCLDADLALAAAAFPPGVAAGAPAAEAPPPRPGARLRAVAVHRLPNRLCGADRGAGGAHRTLLSCAGARARLCLVLASAAPVPTGRGSLPVDVVVAAVHNDPRGGSYVAVRTADDAERDRDAATDAQQEAADQHRKRVAARIAAILGAAKSGAKASSSGPGSGGGGSPDNKRPRLE